MCGSTMSAKSHSSAGASSSVSTSRRCHRRCAGVLDMLGPCRVRGGKANSARRIETEEHAFAYFQVGESSGLWQRHAKLETAHFLGEKHGGVGAIEQQA